MPYKLIPSRGFAVRSFDPAPSPYAIGLFGGQPDLPQRSRLSIRLIKEDMLRMGSNKVKVVDPIFDYVVADAFRAFSFDKPVQPIHLNDLFDMPLDIRRSSPGYPWCDNGYKSRGEVMDDHSARNSIRWFWHRIKAGQKMGGPDVKVLYRAHMESEGMPKIRAVYGYPTTITLGEAIFAKPLIEGFKRNPTPLAFGYDMLTGGAKKVRRECLQHKHFLCLDYSGFDKTISNQLIDIAFMILERNLDFRTYKGSGVPDSRRLARAYWYIREYFKKTPLRLCNGERWMKTSGIPSGSYFTQMVGSIVNYIITSYAFVKATGVLPDYLRVFGDDSVLAHRTPFRKYRIFEEIEKCGMLANPDKTIQCDDVSQVEFLGFKVGTGFPVRKLEKWLCSLYWPERPDYEWDDFASRCLGLFYANAYGNIAFHHMCKEVIMKRPFEVWLSRDFRRFLSYIGVDPNRMSKALPTDFQLIRALI